VPLRQVQQVAECFSDDAIREHVALLHQGNCPRCQGPGPVDVHVSYRVWSAIHVTSWSSRPHLCCRRCARKAKLGDAIYSFLLGWWGVPFGLAVTPVQVLRNLGGLLSLTDSSRPSGALVRLVRTNLAREYLQEQARKQAQAGPRAAAPPAGDG
jgi:hypothetical protein